MTTDHAPTEVQTAALDALRTVWDPELALDVVSLGLVYDVRTIDDVVVIDMTLTTPGCPVSEQLPREAAAAVERALPGFRVEVNTVWDPPWTPERLSPDAMQRLGFGTPVRAGRRGEAGRV